MTLLGDMLMSVGMLVGLCGGLGDLREQTRREYL